MEKPETHRLKKLTHLTLSGRLVSLLFSLQPLHASAEQIVAPVFGPVEIGSPISMMPAAIRPLNGAPAKANLKDCGPSEENGFITGCEYQDRNGYVYWTDGRRIYSVSLSRPYLRADVSLPYGLSVDMSCEQAARQLETARRRPAKTEASPESGNCTAYAGIGQSLRFASERTFAIDFDSVGRMEKVTVEDSLPAN